MVKTEYLKEKGKTPPTEAMLKDIRLGIHDWIDRFVNAKTECTQPKVGTTVKFISKSDDAKIKSKLEKINCVKNIEMDELQEQVLYGEATWKSEEKEIKIQMHKPYEFMELLKHAKKFEKVKGSFVNNLIAIDKADNAGRSGQNLYLTGDEVLEKKDEAVKKPSIAKPPVKDPRKRLYILKTITTEEGKTLTSMIKDYTKHIKDMANKHKLRGSLLVTYVGYFVYTGRDQTVGIVIMENLAPDISSVKLKYDIKGIESRGLNPDEFPNHKIPQNPTWMEKGFKAHFQSGVWLKGIGLNMSSTNISTNALVLNIIQDDLNFLKKWKIVDYSLLLFFIVPPVEGKSRHSWNATTLNEQTKPREIDLPGKAWTIRMGFIDTLVEQTFWKQIESVSKQGVQEVKKTFNMQNIPAGDVTIQDFLVYADRFMKFASKNMFPIVVRSQSAPPPVTPVNSEAVKAPPTPGKKITIKPLIRTASKLATASVSPSIPNKSAAPAAVKPPLASSKTIK
ncbi:phosphatidylinositol-4-phosphate 5-Kinase domain-containing protein [Ditylenchus destructor]|nr:phosphatidylinositol-4-phosphate 5-Kinase domain-containing protein [Ditylenchus destructor]